MKKIILLGGGGHAKVVFDALRENHDYTVVGVTDVKRPAGLPEGVSYLGSDAVLPRYFASGVKYCFVAVGSVGDPSVRMKVFERARRIGFLFPNIVHPGAIVSRYINWGEGNYIAPGAVVNAGVRLGSHAIINTNACIDHDCVIGDFVHIAPGVSLSGGVTVGRGAHVGTGSSVVESVKIGANTIIGAGSVVTENIGQNAVAYGSPCRKIRARR